MMMLMMLMMIIIIINILHTNILGLKEQQIITLYLIPYLMPEFHYWILCGFTAFSNFNDKLLYGDIKSPIKSMT